VSSALRYTAAVYSLLVVKALDRLRDFVLEDQKIVPAQANELSFLVGHVHGHRTRRVKILSESCRGSGAILAGGVGFGCCQHESRAAADQAERHVTSKST